ncbi:hypothetical protein HK405_009604, partial [Cladochytrium tenue]
MFGNDWFFSVSTGNKRKYAERHGYDLIVLDDPTRDAPAPFAAAAASEGADTPDPTPSPVWSKVSGLRKHIFDYDWIWLLDADAFITNYGIKVEDFVADIERIHLARATDRRPSNDGDDQSLSNQHHHEKVPGPPPPVVLPYPPVWLGPRTGPEIIVGMDCNGINAGSLLIRGARGSVSPAEDSGSDITTSEGAEHMPWIVQLLDFWLAMEPLPAYHGSSGGMLEQSALAAAIDGNVLGARARVATVPLRLLNSYPSSIDCISNDDPYTRIHQAGDWVIHFVHVSKASLNETLYNLG